MTIERVFYRIVVPTDFSACAEEEEGRRWAQERLDGRATKAKSEGLDARVALRSGAPYEEIVALAAYERADLVVMGTHGRGGVGRALLGSVADRVVRMAPCPVLTVRHPR